MALRARSVEAHASRNSRKTSDKRANQEPRVSDGTSGFERPDLFGSGCDLQQTPETSTARPDLYDSDPAVVILMESRLSRPEGWGSRSSASAEGAGQGGGRARCSKQPNEGKLGGPT